jgi:hypothetical protein
MGKLGTGRNNQLSQNGLLYDSDGNVFDLTEWYKRNAIVDISSLNKEILDELKDLNYTLKQIHNMEL